MTRICRFPARVSAEGKPGMIGWRTGRTEDSVIRSVSEISRGILTDAWAHGRTSQNSTVRKQKKEVSPRVMLMTVIR